MELLRDFGIVIGILVVAAFVPMLAGVLAFRAGRWISDRIWPRG